MLATGTRGADTRHTMQANHHLYFIALAALIVASSFGTSAAAYEGGVREPLTWTDDTYQLPFLGTHGIDIHIDPTGVKTFEDVSNVTTLFQLSHSAVAFVEFGPSALWVRLEFQNNSSSQEVFYLDAAYGFFDEIDFILVRSDGSKERQSLGDIYPFKNRPVNKVTFVFPFRVPKGERVTLYVRAKAEELTLLPMHLYGDGSLRDETFRIELRFGLLTGAVLITLLYNLGLFFSLRDKNYLLFVIYGAANYLMLASYAGHGFQYFWPDSPSFHAVSIQAFGCLQSATLMLFSRHYLALPKEEGLTKFSIALEWLCWLAVPAAFFIAPAVFLSSGALLSATTHFFCFVLAIRAARQGHRHAWFYLVAFGLLILMMTGNGLMTLAPETLAFALDAASFFGTALSLALGLQLALLSLGLGDRMKLIQEENAAMVQANLDFQSKAREELQVEVGRHTQTLREQNEELQELDKQKTHFFQNVSHELRTPLTLILNPLEAMQQSEKQNESLDMAVRNARRLLRLVNQLLDFQKLGAGRKKIDLHPLDIVRFTHICGDYFASACSTKGVSFSLSINGAPFSPEDLKSRRTFIRGEVDSLEKVAFNYLSNALKFTPAHGSIELGLATTEDNVRLFVRDTGPGIDPGHRARLFQTFSQIDGTSTRAYEGTGLGLAYVKSLTQAMEGTVGVESAPGDGSTFWADFKLCHDPGDMDTATFEIKDWLLADTAGDRRPQLRVDGPKGNQETIVVVDDLPDMRRLISATLRESQYHVVTANNGLLGLEKTRELMPNLVISDWMMPEMTGPELVKSIKADTDLASTPVILLTAKSDAESKLLGTEVGADVFLGKPFNSKELLSVVHNLLKLKAREKEVAKLNRHITEDVLKRYLPPNLIEDILAGRLNMEDEAKAMNITVLFSDLSGFTAMSELLGADKMATLLNQYLSKMNEVIFSHGGTIDKFMGDGIMVLFGAPRTTSDAAQANAAVSCGQGMQEALRGLNAYWQVSDLPAITMRIGIHQGVAVVGNFGSQQRSDYTAIGPTVNLASRIESACAQDKVYISEAVAGKLAKNAALEVGEFSLKGIQEPMRLFEAVSTPNL